MAVPPLAWALRSNPVDDPVTISLSGTTAKTSAALPPGKYQAWAPVAWFVKRGVHASVEAALTSCPLQAYQILTFYVTQTGVDDGIAGILSASTSTAIVQALK